MTKDDRVPLLIRIDRSTRRHLEEEAAVKGTTMAALARFVLRGYLQRERRKRRRKRAP